MCYGALHIIFTNFQSDNSRVQIPHSQNMCCGQFQHNPQHPAGAIHICSDTTEANLECY